MIDGSLVLRQRRDVTYSLHSQEWNNDGWDLNRCDTDQVSSSIAWKKKGTAPQKRLQPRSFITITLPSHRAAGVRQFFVDKNFEVLPHAPYSPDGAPSCFRLLPTLKDTLRDRIFSSHSALPTAIFPSGHNEPLKKRLVWPCNGGISILKKKFVFLQGDYVQKWLHFQLPRMSKCNLFLFG